MHFLPNLGDAIYLLRGFRNLNKIIFYIYFQAEIEEKEA